MTETSIITKHSKSDFEKVIVFEEIPTMRFIGGVLAFSQKGPKEYIFTYLSKAQYYCTDHLAKALCP